MAEGVTTIKVKIGVEIERDIAVVAAVREAIGSAGKIRVDANQGYRTWREAVRAITRDGEIRSRLCRAAGRGAARDGGGQRAHQRPGHGRRKRLDTPRTCSRSCASTPRRCSRSTTPSPAASRAQAAARGRGRGCVALRHQRLGGDGDRRRRRSASRGVLAGNLLPGTIPVTSTAETIVTKVAGHKYLDDLIKTPFRFDKGCALRAGRTRPRHRGGRGEDREIPHRLMAVHAIKTIAIIGAGNGGCAAAAQLTQRGFDIRLYGRSARTTEPLSAIGGSNTRACWVKASRRSRSSPTMPAPRSPAPTSC